MKLLSENRPDEVRRWCQRAYQATTAEEQAAIAHQLLLLGPIADPALKKEADDAFAALGANGAPQEPSQSPASPP
jgi:hypothetical protein